LNPAAFLVALALFVLAPAAGAQQPGKVARVGIVLHVLPARDFSGPSPPHPFAAAFVQTLREHGWIQGENLELHWRSQETKEDRLAPIIGEFAGMPIDVLVASGNQQAIHAMKTVPRLPIVIVTAYHPDEYGIVRSLAKPGGMVTGALLEPGRGINAKRLALLKETVPGLKRVAYLDTRFGADVHEELRQAALSQGIEAFPVTAHDPTLYESAFADARRRKADAMLVGSHGIYNLPTVQQKLHALAIKYRLPTLHCLHVLGQSGGLMSYATDVRENYSIAARHVDRILRGAKPGDLPMEQPERFAFTVNLGAAKAIGLHVPHSVLTQADRIIP